MNSVNIYQGTFRECVAISKNIPEFDSPYDLVEYKKRCYGIHLTFIAEIHHKPVGFKVGYDRFQDGSFYSWMGGVLPDFRNQGIANALADHQENWAKENGFNSVNLKTRKKHKAMIQFSLNRGFVITEEIEMKPVEETRVWMEKSLI